jgi:hypothetical protein
MSRMLRDNPKVASTLKTLPRLWNCYAFSMYHFRLKPPRGIDPDQCVFVHSHCAAHDVYRKEWRVAKEVLREHGIWKGR